LCCVPLAFGGSSVVHVDILERGVADLVIDLISSHFDCVGHRARLALVGASARQAGYDLESTGEIVERRVGGRCDWSWDNRSW
jgi:hypothetical protein